MYKRRILENVIKKLFASFPCVVVSGARQVGKSTVLGEVFDYKTVVFDPAIDISGARRDPDLFLDNNPAPLVLDEIQYAPELVGAIKRRIDKDKKPSQYILTGSQQWSVMKSISESMAGRAVFIDMEGYSLSEIAEDTPETSWLERWLDSPDDFIREPSSERTNTRTLYEQLWRGFLPEANTLPEDLIPRFYQSYLRTYIERDVRLVGDVNDWQTFGRFVQLLSALTSQEINHSQLGREIGMSPGVSRKWLGMMNATFQWYEVPPYFGNTMKRISKKPKGYISDTGLASSLQMISSPRSIGGHPLMGAFFETAVVGEIRKMLSVMNVPATMYHWRSHGGAEVDLILERDSLYYPIEIKLTANPNKEDTRGILEFRKTYPRLRVAPGLVITPSSSFSKISAKDYSMSWNFI